ncbi:hypothetical protein [Rhodococcus rhodnii]|uniref:hypothetical protein n=1 Tax=Rhodococcus rhodnii TaxID=38312 RepID=UPI000933767D|nr:hypothetical protein [Rhodococcus rhodnii]
MPAKTTTTASSAEWDTVENLVKNNVDELTAATDHLALRTWAADNGLATKTLFPKFKTVLLKRCGIDYTALREQARATERDEIAAAAADAPTVLLSCAGDDEARSYAVCGPDGAPAWYGEFFADDKTWTEGDQSSADLSAAKKALFLAGKTREELKLGAINVELHVVNHDVTIDSLAFDAIRARAIVTVHIDDDGNDALEWCRENGYRNWREQNLSELLAPGENAEDDAEEVA